jgi:hypothetical protein
MTLEQVLSVAKQLNEMDQLRLIQQLMQNIKLTQLAQSVHSPQPRVSSFGILSHLGMAPTAEAIDQMRHEISDTFGEDL